jgi:ketosteroid isomerase-like protein
MRGSVVAKVDQEAYVCLGDNAVREGDAVALYRNSCTPAVRGPVCQRQIKGEGTVTKVLNEHFSVVTFPASMTFGEGDTVERKR